MDDKIILFWFNFLLVAPRKHFYFLAYSTEVDQQEPQAILGQTKKLCYWNGCAEIALKGSTHPQTLLGF